MKIRITADSTCDLAPDYIARHSIVILPLTVSMGGRDFVDGRDIVPDDIFRHVDAGGDLPKTAAVNTADYRRQFEALLAECDAIIHFNISADFSSCHEHAVAAAQGLPVYCVDSRNLSSGIALLVCEAVDMISAGCEDPKAIMDRISALIDKVDASFILDRLDYLHKGGRCSTVAMLGANLLKLKPCIEVVDGKMIVGRKYRGTYSRCLKQYVDDRLRHLDAVDNKRIFITHTGVSREDFELTKAAVLAHMSFDEVIEVRAGCSITSHCGQGTLGILFIRK
ncbi:MAG: DegV family protein [Clostridia bacterium]|nr:DegV family protein [Clostridia bacterium]